MTVTDEMIEVAAKDIWLKHRGGIEPVWSALNAWHLDKEACIQQATVALAAAYPLIRAQVLEEAAKAIDRRYMGDNNREDAEAKRCAQVIREMK